ncbi:hypothetical protein ABIB57_004216 [Devosia sp. UYZn731]|uniref:GFA family protein n=1 Tax=Devosia sp. UYZn731 TaxID=3156345 RepID=UPI00339B04B9
MKQTYSGGCHCGALRFEADIDVAAGSDKCNCSVCAKARFWSFKVDVEDFRSLGVEEHRADYVFGSGVAHHYFCQKCGIRPYEYVELPDVSRKYYNVSVVALDAIDMDAVMSAPIKYEDGLHDRWDRQPAEIRHL